MARADGAETRRRILDASEALILGNGYTATSIEDIIGEVGITKGTFFYHFKTKSDLARALIERFASQDRKLLESTKSRAEKLATDPLQRVLIFVGLLVEMGEEMAATTADPNPGCLFASYCYESGQFDGETMGVIDTAIQGWQEVFGEMLRAAAEKHPPRLPVDLEDVANMLTVVFEGAYILSRIRKDPHAFTGQIRQYRNYLELLFGDTA